MFCSNCGKESNGRFCPDCGTRLQPPEPSDATQTPTITPESPSAPPDAVAAAPTQSQPPPVQDPPVDDVAEDAAPIAEDAPTMPPQDSTSAQPDSPMDAARVADEEASDGFAPMPDLPTQPTPSRSTQPKHAANTSFFHNKRNVAILAGVAVVIIVAVVLIIVLGQPSKPAVTSAKPTISISKATASATVKPTSTVAPTPSITYQTATISDITANPGAFSNIQTSGEVVWGAANAQGAHEYILADPANENKKIHVYCAKFTRDGVAVTTPYANGAIVGVKATQKGTSAKDSGTYTSFEMDSLTLEKAAPISYAKADYKELSRNPSAHIGDYITFTGRVVQVMEGSYMNTYRISSSGKYDDIFYVTYIPGSGEARILEDDTVTVKGQFGGLQSYETVMGATLTIPKCSATTITVK